MKITTQDFRAAKMAAKKTFVNGYCADRAAAHKAAAETLKSRCPEAGAELVADMAWQCVLAARNA